MFILKVIILFQTKSKSISSVNIGNCLNHQNPVRTVKNYLSLLKIKSLFLTLLKRSRQTKKLQYTAKCKGEVINKFLRDKLVQY